jgi:ketosteroid isomerase-like protein
MSAENAEIFRRVFEAMSRRDTDAFIARYHPEIKLDTPMRIWAG